MTLLTKTSQTKMKKVNLGLDRDTPTENKYGQDSCRDGEPPVHPNLFEFKTGTTLPLFRNTVAKPKRDVFRRTGDRKDLSVHRMHRKQPLFSLPRINKKSSHNYLHKVGLGSETTLAPNCPPHVIGMASHHPESNDSELEENPNFEAVSSCSNIATIFSQTNDVSQKNLLEPPNRRRESLKVHVVKSMYSLTTNPGEPQMKHIDAVLATEEDADDDTYGLSSAESYLVTAGDSLDTWPRWERDSNSNDVEERCIGVIRKKSMAVVLPHVNEDSVDVGRVEITPGLYLTRRVKVIPDGYKGQHKIPECRDDNKTRQMEKLEREDTPTRRIAEKKDNKLSIYSQRKLIPPLYPEVNRGEYTANRLSALGTRSFLGREPPVPISVSRLLPFDSSMQTVRSTMPNDPANPMEFRGVDDRTDYMPLPMVDRQPGIPFRVQDRVRSKKALFKFKKHWDNMKSYLNAVSKLQHEVFVSKSVDMYPRKGL